jgi:crotonobetainyl-CoA:carnitine CoA-transferase CaiB-like acyl-CoA transferase
MASLPLLADLKVLDIGNSWTAYATKLLADLGAVVIKVEEPSGDPMRHWTPVAAGKDGSQVSLHYAYYHANKKGITLDTQTAAAADILRALVNWCDVVVISPDPQDIMARGTEIPDGYLRIKPLLVVASVTGFGLTGPYRGMQSSSAVAHAMSGKLYVGGPPEGPPALFPVNVFVDMAGTAAALAIVSAIRVVPAVGGQVIDIAAHEYHAAHRFHQYAGNSVLVRRSDNTNYIIPQGMWQTKKGTVEFQVWTADQWAGFQKLLANPPELADPRLADTVYRAHHAEYLRPFIAARLLERDAADLFRQAQELHIPSAVLNTPGDLLNDPHAQAQQFFAPVDDGELGRAEMKRSPFRSEPPISAQQEPAPGLGEHNQEVYVDILRFTPSDVEGWRRAGII